MPVARTVELSRGRRTRHFGVLTPTGYKRGRSTRPVYRGPFLPCSLYLLLRYAPDRKTATPVGKKIHDFLGHDPLPRNKGASEQPPIYNPPYDTPHIATPLMRTLVVHGAVAHHYNYPCTHGVLVVHPTPHYLHTHLCTYLCSSTYHSTYLVHSMVHTHLLPTHVLPTYYPCIVRS